MLFSSAALFVLESQLDHGDTPRIVDHAAISSIRVEVELPELVEAEVVFPGGMNEGRGPVVSDTSEGGRCQDYQC